MVFGDFIYFMKHFLVGGIFAGLFMVLIKNRLSSYAGWINGALPLSFIYVALVGSFSVPVSEILKFTIFTMIGGVFFVLYLLIFYVSMKWYNIYISLFVMSIFVVITTCIYVLLERNGSMNKISKIL